MKAQLNLFIVDDNKLMVTDLRYYLENRFGSGLSISTFYDGESCLKRVDGKTDIVILDYFLNGKNGLETLKSIKAINPETEVVIFSGNEDIGLAIETFRAGATDYVVKGEGAWKKMTRVINSIITEPLKLIVREFGVSKFMAAFLLTFVAMGVVVVFVLNIIS